MNKILYFFYEILIYDNFIYCGILGAAAWKNSGGMGELFEICHYEPFVDHHSHEQEETALNEAPAGMVASLLIAAVMLIVLGVYSGDIVTNIIQFAIT